MASASARHCTSALLGDRPTAGLRLAAWNTLRAPLCTLEPQVEAHAPAMFEVLCRSGDLSEFEGETTRLPLRPSLRAIGAASRVSHETAWGNC